MCVCVRARGGKMMWCGSLFQAMLEKQLRQLKKVADVPVAKESEPAPGAFVHDTDSNTDISTRRVPTTHTHVAPQPHPCRHTHDVDTTSALKHSALANLVRQPYSICCSPPSSRPPSRSLSLSSHPAHPTAPPPACPSLCASFHGACVQLPAGSWRPRQ
jgi:hypothetical protein